MAGVGAVAGAAQLSAARSATQAEGTGAAELDGVSTEASSLLNGHHGAAKEGTLLLVSHSASTESEAYFIPAKNCPSSARRAH